MLSVKFTDYDSAETMVREVRHIVDSFRVWGIVNNTYKDIIHIRENRIFKVKEMSEFSERVIRGEMYKLDLELQGILSILIKQNNYNTISTILISLSKYYPNTIRNFCNRNKARIEENFAFA